jgi:hypothetical protein
VSPIIYLYLPIVAFEITTPDYIKAMDSVDKYIQHIRNSATHAASPIFMFAHAWEYPYSACRISATQQYPINTLINSQTQLPTEVVVLGTVSKDRLYCSPVGTFDAHHPLSSAKFKLLLTQPNDARFVPDYERALRHLSHLQQYTSPNIKAKGMLSREGLTLGADIFELKVSRSNFQMTSHTHMNHFSE